MIFVKIIILVMNYLNVFIVIIMNNFVVTRFNKKSGLKFFKDGFIKYHQLNNFLISKSILSYI